MPNAVHVFKVRCSIVDMGMGDTDFTQPLVSPNQPVSWGCRGHIPFNILAGEDVSGNIPSNIFTYVQIIADQY